MPYHNRCHEKLKPRWWWPGTLLLLFFFNSGWGQRRWLNLRREVKERCSRQSHDKGHITRAPWDTNPGEITQGNVSSCWLQSGLGLLLSAWWGITENWGQRSGMVYVFKSSFFYLSLTHGPTRARTGTQMEFFWSPIQWFSHLSSQLFSIPRMSLVFFLFSCPLHSYLWSPDQILKLLLPVPQAFGSLGTSLPLSQSALIFSHFWECPVLLELPSKTHDPQTCSSRV